MKEPIITAEGRDFDKWESPYVDYYDDEPLFDTMDEFNDAYPDYDDDYDDEDYE